MRFARTSFGILLIAVFSAISIPAHAVHQPANNRGCDTDYPYLLCVETVSSGAHVNAVRAQFKNNWNSTRIVGHVELSSGAWRYNTADQVHDLDFWEGYTTTQWFYPNRYTNSQVCGTLWQKLAANNYKRLVTTCISPD